MHTPLRTEVYACVPTLSSRLGSRKVPQRALIRKVPRDLIQNPLLKGRVFFSWSPTGHKERGLTLDIYALFREPSTDNSISNWGCQWSDGDLTPAKGRGMAPSAARIQARRGLRTRLHLIYT
jgi:hypothetical protein